MARHNVGLKHRNLPLLLLQGRERVMGRFRPLLNEHGVTEQQWRVVRVLLDTSPLEPRQIGELCGISSPSLAGILERMEPLGLIERKRVVHDQRRVHVSLTSRSRRLAESMAPAINEIYERIKDQMGPGLWNSLQKALDDLLGALPTEAPTMASDLTEARRLRKRG